MSPHLALFRFFLAVTVVLYHVWAKVAPAAGTPAVFGFFFISGYLIRQLLQENYQNRPKAFIFNRFLRIYPAYLVSIIIGAIFIVFFRQAMVEANAAHTLPRTINAWLDNIFIFGLEYNTGRIIPTAWSLNVELIWYTFAFVFSFLPKTYFYTAVGVFLLIPVIGLLNGQPFDSDSLSCFFCFGIGSLRYDFKNFRLPSKFLEGTILIGFIFYLFGLPHLFEIPYTTPWFIYLTPCWMFLFFPLLTDKKIEHAPIAEFLGILSYPLFLCHLIGSGLAIQLGYAKNTGLHFLITLVIGLAVSVIVLQLTDIPLKALRSRIRKNS